MPNMSRKPRSLKQVQAQLADQLRATDHSWAEIGREFQRRFHVNARVALRQARGWTQSFRDNAAKVVSEGSLSLFDQIDN
jgi:hypothetical protein